MKKTIFLIILLLGVVSCSQNNVVNFNKNSTLVIEERVGDGLSNEYEVINEINDEELVKKVIDILESVDWEKSIDVDMEYEADYKINEDYHIWIQPKGNTLAIIFAENSNYVHLSEVQSSDLFTLITGEEL